MKTDRAISLKMRAKSLAKHAKRFEDFQKELEAIVRAPRATPGYSLLESWKETMHYKNQIDSLEQRKAERAQPPKKFYQSKTKMGILTGSIILSFFAITAVTMYLIGRKHRKEATPPPPVQLTATWQNPNFPEPENKSFLMTYDELEAFEKAQTQREASADQRKAPANQQEVSDAQESKKQENFAIQTRI